MTPASNMKLVTTAAALHYLGPDFTYLTGVGLIGDYALNPVDWGIFWNGKHDWTMIPPSPSRTQDRRRDGRWSAASYPTTLWPIELKAASAKYLHIVEAVDATHCPSFPRGISHSARKVMTICFSRGLKDV